LSVDQREHLFFLACEAPPTQVVIDPHRDLLATLEVEKPLELWREELRKAPEARARSEAALALGKDASRAAIETLGEALREDRFWGTQAACAQALARARTPGAKEALLRGLGVAHPKARRAVVAALGEFRGDSEVAEALRRRLEAGDPSYFVEGELARSLGMLRFPQDLSLLQEVLKRPSFVDTVAVGAIDGLAASASPDAFALLLPLLRYGQPTYRRRAAVAGLARLGELLGKKAEVADALLPVLRDPHFRVQLAAVDAVRALGERRLIGPIEEIPFADGRLRRHARDAARALRASGGGGPELAAMRDELEQLKGETRQLKEGLEALKSRAAPAKKKIKPKPARRKGRR
jgi:aminopeptidase N